MENYENREVIPEWIRPNLQKERGEIERVIKEFLLEDLTKENLRRVVNILEQTPLSELSDEEWSSLENTDSFHNVQTGQVEDARGITEEYNQKLNPENQRDFEALLQAFRQGQSMEAPTILKHKGRSHLVSGNTRLMIARALNIRPKVVIGEVE